MADFTQEFVKMTRLGLFRLVIFLIVVLRYPTMIAMVMDLFWKEKQTLRAQKLAEFVQVNYAMQCVIVYTTRSNDVRHFIHPCVYCYRNIWKIIK